jgi:hypothetical protein
MYGRGEGRAPELQSDQEPVLEGTRCERQWQRSIERTVAYFDKHVRAIRRLIPHGVPTADRTAALMADGFWPFQAKAPGDGRDWLTTGTTAVDM